MEGIKNGVYNLQHSLENISGKPKGEIYGKNITNHVGMFMFSSVLCVMCVTIVIHQFSHEYFTDIYSDSWLSKQGWFRVNNIWDFHDIHFHSCIFWVIYHGIWSEGTDILKKYIASLNFTVTPCTSNIQHFNIQLMHIMLKNIVIKTF